MNTLIPNIRIIVFLLIVTLYNDVNAKVTLPAIFGSNMVLQQQTQANLWGSATPNSIIKIQTSWNNQIYQVKVDKSGNWKVAVSTPEAGGPYTIIFNDGEQTVLDNILIGEVWLCSGQSNMEVHMKGFKNQPVANSTQAIMQSKNADIRLFTVKRNASFEPLSDVTGHWQEANPESVREFSASAYYFGEMLQEQLNVPIGLITSAWGGSSCEAWMKEDWLKSFPDIKMPQSNESYSAKNRVPTMLYNGMIAPIISTTIKGVIWYQGETNYDRASNYADLFSKMIEGWRDEWNQGSFPFYFCQIAPYNYAYVTHKDKPVINSAFLREQQLMAEQRNENVGMAILLDVGLEKCIHPSNKQITGERLARLALSKTYGLKGFPAESPIYKEIEIKNDTVVVSFNRAPMWLNTNGTFESKHFTVAGRDRVFYPTKAWIERSKVLVKSDSVAQPVAVRYAFDNWVEGDLYGEDLPVSSFRSDSWE